MYEYRESCVLCFTKTWLTPAVDSNALYMEGFGTPVRLDRDVNATGKTIGGGVCMYINQQWCKNYVVREKLCTSNIELLSVSMRPTYLPREFGQIFIVNVYIPPGADNKQAADILHQHVQSLELISPDAPNLILGDFNGCTLKSVLPNYEQYVKCHTRRNRTLDLCYGNVKGAYKAVDKPPLGASDHNTVHLLPCYKQKLKTGKPEVKTVKSWDADSIATLQGCFDCTDWNTLVAGCSDLDSLTDTVTDYINFCIDSVIPCKKINIYPNNKPWVTKDLKYLLNKKKVSYCKGNLLEVKSIQRDISVQIKKCKEDYKRKVEREFMCGDSRKMWKSLKTMIGCEQKREHNFTSDVNSFAHDLNSFYCRFDNVDFAQDLQHVLASENIKDAVNDIVLSVENVKSCFAKINVRKATGPDNLPGIVLRSCADQLSPIFCKLYQTSLDAQTVPSLWKNSTVTPIPKKCTPKELNDYRPIALTSVAMKCFERVLLPFLLQNIGDLLDPLQFAYRARRGVEDATLCVLNSLYKHLETPKSYARIMFVDFSSAFNTIQPHLLVRKLIDMNVNASLINWISNFLTNRTQSVRINSHHSSTATISTGAPQGCVLSPLLFIIYTNDCVAKDSCCSLVKFADDAALVALLQGSNEDGYRSEIQNLSHWCQDNYLQINVKKTKEIIIDFRNRESSVKPVYVNDTAVEIVSEYKYLGTIIDDKLNWNINTENVYKKCQQRLHFLRKLRSFGVDVKLLKLFYTSFVQSVWSFGMQCWYNSLSLQNKNKIIKIVNISSKIVGTILDHPDYVNEKKSLSHAQKIICDSTHILCNEYTLLPSGRRYKVPCFKSNRSKKSFIPYTISLLNDVDKKKL